MVTFVNGWAVVLDNNNLKSCCSGGLRFVRVEPTLSQNGQKKSAGFRFSCSNSVKQNAFRRAFAHHKYSVLMAESRGIRARGSASRPQRIPNAIPSMVLDGVGVEY